MTDIISTVAFDPQSGEWKLRLGNSEASQWSKPMTLQRLQNALMAEYDRRLRDGQQAAFYANSISAEVILSHGLLADSHQVKRLEASDKKLIEAKKRRLHHDAMALDGDQLLEMIGLD